MKIKVGVLFGGQSVEHEVSIISALQAVSSFDNDKYDVIPIYITRDNAMYVGESISSIDEYNDIKKLIEKSQRVIFVNDSGKLELIKYPTKRFGSNVYDYVDVVMPIVHGTNVEDGALQGYVKYFNVPIVGCDVLSSAVGMDKYVMKMVLKDNEVPVLDCITFNIKQYQKEHDSVLESVENKFGYPVIVKPVNLGSSVGIKIASDRNELEEAFDNAFTYSLKVLCEKALTDFREINCAVLGDYEHAEASECEEPINKDEILSYADKYLSGDKTGGAKGMTSAKRILPANITSEQKSKIQSLAVKAFMAVGCCGVTRVDFMIDNTDGNIYVTEVNTIPGSLAFYLWEASGIKYKELLDRLVSLALKREREMKDVSFSFDTNILAGYKGGIKGSKL